MYIIGGGVAGLHTGITLAKKGFQCTIIDEYQCGGRVQTFYAPSFHWENGAGRIATTHHSVPVSYTHLTLPTNREV